MMPWSQSRDNPRLKGILPKDYARPALDKNRLGELIDLIGTIGLGEKENRSKDILGRVYEYFLSRFASAEGNLHSSRRPRKRLRLYWSESCRRDFIKCCGVLFRRKAPDVHGCFSSQSFWNAGSPRRASHSGWSLRSAGVRQSAYGISKRRCSLESRGFYRRPRPRRPPKSPRPWDRLPHPSQLAAA